jgi:hypothetical protein
MIYTCYKNSIHYRDENRMDYFRPNDQPKTYGRQKWIWLDNWQIRSWIRLVIHEYKKGYGFTNIRPYSKIYHISRLYLDNIDKIFDNGLLSMWLGEKIKESYTFCLMVHKHHHARHKLVLYELGNLPVLCHIWFYQNNYIMENFPLKRTFSWLSEEPRSRKRRNFMLLPWFRKQELRHRNL